MLHADVLAQEKLFTSQFRLARYKPNLLFLLKHGLANG